MPWSATQKIEREIRLSPFSALSLLLPPSTEPLRAMATSTKQQSTYKKRVISESDDEGSSSGAEDDVPLSARAAGSEAAPSVGAPEMAKTASNEGKHIPQDVVSGSVILKEAAGSSATSQVSVHTLFPKGYPSFESSRRGRPPCWLGLEGSTFEGTWHLGRTSLCYVPVALVSYLAQSSGGVSCLSLPLSIRSVGNAT